ncbi:DUF6456 domain-containing protein [Yoonia sp. R2331]|uniref:DUF6456 domain-containing protein n=1 Tax=Yoonia sp. R2331 TaxID=3237238 RepID=UPI0034E37C33
MSEKLQSVVQLRLPDWVPHPVHLYLAHTVAGLSIRALARDSALHPSTVLRQVRRFEARRDDPLVDDALKALVANDLAPAPRDGDAEIMQNKIETTQVGGGETLSLEQIEAEALPILRRLCEPGAVLAVARDMETAVIVREDPNGESFRTAIADRQIAQAMALKSWINTADPSLRIVRYFVTAAGRAALRGLTAETENRAQGFREASPRRRDGSNVWDLQDSDTGNGRYVVTESPLVGLARRRDKDGKHFLSPALVQAGERLREDYELCYVGPTVAENWQAALQAKVKPNTAQATIDARARVFQALTELGPGLADIALRCCCFLEGLEVTEKSMGWSARSGKIVLRIALQRLVRHYEEQGKFRPMIG